MDIIKSKSAAQLAIEDDVATLPKAAEMHNLYMTKVRAKFIRADVKVWLAFQPLPSTSSRGGSGNSLRRCSPSEVYHFMCTSQEAFHKESYF
ncbi:hypothetical protein PG997_008261 [Apiospora hydei]|uniref:Uncharacterized protein n=1 Tax=Apiospora hydei TaxID=1337664 RepID=A0ABR1WAC7_9PEZI